MQRAVIEMHHVSMRCVPVDSVWGRVTGASTGLQLKFLHGNGAEHKLLVPDVKGRNSLQKAKSFTSLINAPSLGPGEPELIEPNAVRPEASLQ